ncbi:MAG TPA: ABC transporter permease subunit [Actinomycetota bacterium]|nr:ABC transporter permease subunit [Actinomycetota bacterium]
MSVSSLTARPPVAAVEPAKETAPTDEPRALSTRSVDDVASVVGSALGSLALTWIVYSLLLPLSGVLGFLICWYVAFLVMYACVAALSHPRPIVISKLMSVVMTSAAAIVGFALVTVVAYTVGKGLKALLHVSFFTRDMAGVGPTTPLGHGGIWHAIVGSFIMLGIAVAVSLPFGLATAVFMTEVGGWFAKVVRTIVEAMTAVPDLLAGLFVYVTLIVGLGWERTGLAAAIAISVTMIPIIARSAEVALRVVPGGLREAGQALGASHWQTVRRVVLPTARPGLATALILAMARGVGETAPLLIVSGASTYLNANPTKGPMNSLPLFIYSAIRSPDELTIQRGFAAAVVLLAVVFVLFAITRFVAFFAIKRFLTKRKTREMTSPADLWTG